MSQRNLTMEGAFTALITPFNDGRVDHDALESLVERQIDGGIDGLVPCGTTGEAATMTAEERLAVIQTVVKVANGRVPIIAGTGSNDTVATIRFTRMVEEIDGVDGALVVTPYYNKPGQKAMIQHFSDIANSTDLPIVLYNVPGRTAVSMTAQTVAELAQHDNIIAIKEASGDMVLDTQIVELTPENFKLLSGDDFTTLPLLSIGGSGCISVVSNLDPAAMKKMCNFMRDGDIVSARAIHAQIQPLARALFADSNPVPVKAALAMMGYCTPELRPPLYELEQELLDNLHEVLQQYGLIYL